MHMKKTGWNELKRRMLALGIAAVMIGNTVDLSALPVLAMEQNQEETVETENPEQKQVQVFDTENVEQDQEQVSDEEQTFDEENAEQNQEQISGTENTEENQPSGEEGVDQEKPAEDSEEHGSETGEVTEDKTAGDEATEEVSEDVRKIQQLRKNLKLRRNWWKNRQLNQSLHCWRENSHYLCRKQMCMM